MAAIFTFTIFLNFKRFYMSTLKSIPNFMFIFVFVASIVLMYIDNNNDGWMTR